MSIRDDGAIAAREAWQRAFRTLFEALKEMPFLTPFREIGSVVAEIDLEKCLNGRIPPQVFRHGGRRWRIVGPYIAEENEEGEILAVFTSNGEPREYEIRSLVVTGSRGRFLRVDNDNDDYRIDW